ncbi:MAG: hypothetical protein MUC50_21185 [Myxococcota bacterium]|nr:hypothetical protein [Myxococcota bacterium]
MIWILAAIVSSHLFSACSDDCDCLKARTSTDSDTDIDADTDSDTDSDAGEGCSSNVDCSEPTSICDTSNGECVECLVLADCAGWPGTVCDAGECNCPDDLEYCGPNLCVDIASDSANCGICGHACFGACVDGACADTWEPVSADGAPSARDYHVAVWAAELGVMIVWGGNTDLGYTNTGAVYDLETYEWQAMSTVNAPLPRQQATAVWSGTEMIVWGGYDGSVLNTGGRYNPTTNTWSSLSTVAAPVARRSHTAVWTGDQMIVWGGRSDANELGSGGVYAPAANTWTATAMNSSGVTRRDHSAVWLDPLGVMMIFGGYGDTPNVTNSYLPASGAPGGEQFNLSENMWQTLNAAGEPPSRASHSMITTGQDLIVWGGYNGSYLATGSRYTVSDGWIALAGAAPAERAYHTAVWIKDVEKMIVWGGQNSISGYLNTGAELNTVTNSWLDATPTALEGRYAHTAVATPDKMIVWGGLGSSGLLGNGGVYTPAP